tara:strand:- start:23552 stop:24223 length:672 start_codon:yes stop_codon:yes gene_type:complete
MATPVKGNTSNANPTPGSNSHSITHNQNAGTNKLLVVFVTMSNAGSRTYTGATYGGVAMTQLYQINRGGLSQRMVCYHLESPADGNNTLQITFNGSQWNPISIHARSFTESGGVGASLRTGGQATPHNGTLTVADDSLIMLTSCSVNQVLTQQIPTGTNRTFTTHNTNRQIATGAISANAGHSAGTIALRATSTFGNVTLDRVEITGLSSSPASQGNFIAMFI